MSEGWAAGQGRGMGGYDSRLVRETYSSVAERYAATCADHLDRDGLGCELLDALARRTPRINARLLESGGRPIGVMQGVMR